MATKKPVKKTTPTKMFDTPAKAMEFAKKNGEKSITFQLQKPKKRK